MLLLICLTKNVACCSNLYHIANGHSRGKCLNAVPYDTCQFQCDFGFVLSGSSTLTCLETRHWSEPRPSCIATTCPDIEAPNMASTSGSCKPGLATRACQFHCYRGYELVGPSGIVCQNNRKWNKLPPRCEKQNEVKCSNMIYPENGGVFLGSCAPGIPGKECTLDCSPNYDLIGKATIMCGQDGVWQLGDMLPQCVKNHSLVS
ncbi:P-selectin [Halotydeus destructor]|nr:P-selectin [Halotydeus destructor]